MRVGDYSKPDLSNNCYPIPLKVMNQSTLHNMHIQCEGDNDLYMTTPTCQQCPLIQEMLMPRLSAVQFGATPLRTAISVPTKTANGMEMVPSSPHIQASMAF